MTAEYPGKGYTPLPQSISNTDTEEDDEHHHNVHDENCQESGATEMIGSNISIKNGRFYPLDETRNLENRIRNERNNLNYCNDDIPIMVLDGEVSNDLWKHQDMSPLRRLCLIVSILVCILTILIFLYVLPCDDSVICPQTIVTPQSSLSWDKTLEGVELHGPISIVPGTPYDLIFLLRGQQYGSENSEVTGREPIPSDGGGVLSMQGNSGTLLWWVTLKRMPTDINCMVLDTDGSGKPDCLVAGEKGLLVSIEPTSGTIHWSSTLYTHSKLPVLLPDVDSDGINDLLSVEIKSGVNLVLLSGKSGQLLGRQKTECQSVELQGLDLNATVSYFCHNTNAKQSTQLISLSQLIDVINLSQQSLQQKLSVKSHASSYNISLSHQILKDNWELTPYYQLHVKNQGICPSELCYVSVNLTLRHMNNESRSIWDHVSSKSFATKPAILNTTGQPYATGFALKFWHWTDANVGLKNSISSDVIKRTWNETVLICYMNHTEVHVMNASQSEVVQMCRGDNCQPNFELQSHSIAIADLNNDGLWDLINYRTSYDFNQTKILSSKVQIVKLDTVL